MTISFRCQHCGKRVEAPDSMGGKRGRCPYCKQSNYIPAPVSDDELIDLAPEDEESEKRTAQEIEALRRQERGLIAEMDAGDSTAVPLERRKDLKPEDLYQFVINYCLDLAGSRLEMAQANLLELKKFRRTATTAVDDFISGKAVEPALANIPAKVLKGFLNQLRQSLT